MALPSLEELGIAPKKKALPSLEELGIKAPLPAAQRPDYLNKGSLIGDLYQDTSMLSPKLTGQEFLSGAATLAKDTAKSVLPTMAGVSTAVGTAPFITPWASVPLGTTVASTVRAGQDAVLNTVAPMFGMEGPGYNSALGYLGEGALDVVTGGAVGGAREMVKNTAKNAARKAATSEFLADPSVQAAERIARSKGAITQSPGSIERSGPKETTLEALERASGRAKDPTSLGEELMVPNSTSTGRPMAAFEELKDATPSIQNTGVFEAGGDINPITGKFQNPALAPKTPQDLMVNVAKGKKDLLEARKIIVNDLDRAMQTFNTKASDPSQTIRGITFPQDVAPKLKGLRDLIAKKSTFKGTEPTAIALQKELDMLSSSMDNILSKTEATRMNMQGGSYQTGELTPGDALTLLENINDYRRSLKEFDQLTIAKGFTSQSDVTGNAAGILAMQEVHAALKASLSDKAGEIITKAKSLPGYYDWSDALQNYDSQVVHRINESYGALADLASPLKEMEFHLSAARSTNIPSKLTTKVEQASIPTNKTAAIGQTIDAAAQKARQLFGAPTPELLKQREIEGIGLNAVSNLRDLAFLRRNPMPVLDRSWQSIRVNPNSKRMVFERAVISGLIRTPEEAEAMPENVQEQLFKEVAKTASDMFMPGPYGFRSFFDGKIEDPMERDVYMKMVKDKNLPPGKEAEIIGSLLSDKKFVPMDEAPAPTIQAPSMPTPSMEQMSSMLSGIVPGQEQPAQQMQFAPESMKMLQEMRGAQSQRDYARSGG